ncbi:MAG: hypothetical protein IPN71_01090 [Fibrobacteres bacterium]|nr:hypothetical protein [Fibrobacterota bacterium]
MRKYDTGRLLLASLALTFFVTKARADWLMPGYAIAASDSAQSNRIYGIRTVGNAASATNVSVWPDSAGNFVRFNASKIASDSTEGYSADVGLIHPLKPDAKERNLTGLHAIRFEYRLSAPVTEALTVSFGSSAYTPRMMQFGEVHEGYVEKPALSVVSTWQTAELLVLDMYTPTWWIASADFPEIESVLRNVHSLRFRPRSTYDLDGASNGIVCSKCVGPTMTRQILDIRKVELVGLPGEPPLSGLEPETIEPNDTLVVVDPPPPPGPDTSGYLLSDYALPATDSAKTNSLYGIQSAANPASQATSTVFGGFVRLQAPVIASEPKSQGYSAYVGLIHPIFPDWHSVDVSGLTSLSFEFRNTDKITDRLLVAFGSSAYSTQQQYAGTIYQNDVSGVAKLAPSTIWKSVQLDAMDFYAPSWWDAPADFPTFDSVLRSVHSLQIVPQTTYLLQGVQGDRGCTKCVGPTMTQQTLDIRNIRLNGVAFPTAVVRPDSLKDSCSGSNAIVLDDFLDGNRQNRLGGSWVSYSDSTGPGAGQGEQVIGSSSAALSVVRGSASLDAALDKKVGDVWHSGAGWAGLAASLGEGIDLDGLTGIQFQIHAQALSSRVGLSLKVFEKGVPEAEALSVAVKSGATSVCVTPESLKPPQGSGRSHRLDLSNIEKFAWEAKIHDKTHPFIDTARAAFSIRNVRLFGADPVRVSQSLRHLGRQTFSVHYGDGALQLEGLEGIGQVEIRNLQGKTVASFAAASRVPLALAKGTYVLSARRNGASLTKSFAVMGR